VGFLGLVAACWVIARHYSGTGRSGRAWFARITGVAFLLGFGAIASGSSSPAVVLAFWAALLLAWGWLATVALDLYREVAR
jgi:hypothetical protein